MHKGLLAAIGVVLAAGSANAGTVLATTAMNVPSGNGPTCEATNLGKGTLDVNIRIVDINGLDIVAAVTPLAPGETNGLATSIGFSGFARCQFEFKGSRRNVRGALVVLDNVSGLPIATLVAQ